MRSTESAEERVERQRTREREKKRRQRARKLAREAYVWRDGTWVKAVTVTPVTPVTRVTGVTSGERDIPRRAAGKRVSEPAPVTVKGRAKATRNGGASPRSCARAQAELAEATDELGADELRVLAHLARRLLAGQQQYGRLDLAADGRDWRHERAEELADALIYGAFAEVAGEIEGGRR